MICAYAPVTSLQKAWVPSVPRRNRFSTRRCAVSVATTKKSSSASFVTVRSAELTLVARSDSFAERTNRRLVPAVGSACVAARSSVTTGPAESKVTWRSARVAIEVAAFPARSATEKLPDGAIVTAPWPAAVTVMRIEAGFVVSTESIEPLPIERI